jgi:hypothetical protein
MNGLRQNTIGRDKAEMERNGQHGVALPTQGDTPMRTILLSTAAAMALLGSAAAADPGGKGNEGGGNAKASATVRSEPRVQAKVQARVQAKAEPDRAIRSETRIAARDDRRAPQRQGSQKQDQPKQAPPKQAAPKQAEHAAVQRSQPARTQPERRDDRRDAERRDDRKDGNRVVVRNENNVTVVQRQQVRPLPAGVRRVEYKDPRGNRIYVPTSNRVRVVTARRDFDWGQINQRRRYIDGCPPGLAKKYNGCMPPGLARPVTYRWAQPDWYGRDWDRQVRYRYLDGYLLRLGTGDRIMSYVPLLGGALTIGRVWPSAYYEPIDLPPYYSQYYGLGSVDNYRYYGNTIYRVNPESSAIASVAALLTGDSFSIGQPMPTGYGVYNVPYGWRDQYVDGPQAMYRYSDGYIYQMDPTTRLVQAAIELIV